MLQNFWACAGNKKWGIDMPYAEPSQTFYVTDILKFCFPSFRVGFLEEKEGYLLERQLTILRLSLKAKAHGRFMNFSRPALMLPCLIIP